MPTVLLRDRYPVEETVRTLETPLLVVLGTSDSIIPPEQSRRVFAAAPGPKTLVEMEGLDHNDPGCPPGPIWPEKSGYLSSSRRENKPLRMRRNGPSPGHDPYVLLALRAGCHGEHLMDEVVDLGFPPVFERAFDAGHEDLVVGDLGQPGTHEAAHS